MASDLLQFRFALWAGFTVREESGVAEQRIHVVWSRCTTLLSRAPLPVVVYTVSTATVLKAVSVMGPAISRPPGFVPSSVRARFVVDRVALRHVVIPILVFPLSTPPPPSRSLSFHYCSIFIYMLLLPGGQTDEVWGIVQKAMLCLS